MPFQRIALYGFLLNMLWEFGQCTVLYDMWSWGFWRRAAWMWGAIAGDVVIVLGVVGLARLAIGTGPMVRPSPQGWMALLAVGLVASVGLEWAACGGYTSWMPTITIGGHGRALAHCAGHVASLRSVWR